MIFEINIELPRDLDVFITLIFTLSVLYLEHLYIIIIMYNTNTGQDL